MAASLQVSTAAVTSSITVFLAVFAIGQLAVGPISDRYGRRWPVLAGFAVFLAGSIWCGLATDLPSLLIGRVIQAAGACSTSVLSRAIARDLFTGAALGRAMALIMIAMAAAPASRHCSAARSTIISAGVPNSSLSARSPCRRHRLCRSARRNPQVDADPAQSAGDHQELWRPDRRPPLPGSGGDREPDHGRTVRDVFGGPPRADRGAAFHPDSARPVFCRHRDGGVRRRDVGDQTGAAVRPRPAIRVGLLAEQHRQHRHPAGVAVPRQLPAVPCHMCVFLLGMGIVNPLGTAQALSPFGEKAGAASALVGFWQMMSAAIAVWLAATVSHQAMFALGCVLTVASLMAVGLYTMRARKTRAAGDGGRSRRKRSLRKPSAFVAGNDAVEFDFYCHTARGYTSAFSRRDAPELCFDFNPPGKWKAQGKPGARCTRWLACKRQIEKRTRAYRFSGSIRPSLRNGFTAYNAISPVSTSSIATVTSEDISAKLGASVGRQNDTTSPSAQATLVSRNFRVHRIPPRVRDDFDPPLSSGEDGRIPSADLPDRLSEIFLQEGMDRLWVICPTGLYAAARIGKISLARGAKQFAPGFQAVARSTRISTGYTRDFRTIAVRAATGY